MALPNVKFDIICRPKENCGFHIGSTSVAHLIARKKQKLAKTSAATFAGLHSPYERRYRRFLLR